MGGRNNAWKYWAPKLGVLAPLWAFRGIEGYVRHRAGAPLGAAHFFAGLWDLSLVWGVSQLGRSVAACGWKRARAAAFAVRALLGVLLGVDLFLRGADAVYGAATGGYFTATVFPYLTRRNLPLLGDGDLPKLLWLFAFGCLLCVLGLYLDARRAADGGRRWSGSRGAGAAAFALLLPFTLGWNTTTEQALRFVPEAVFVREWLTWRGFLGGEDASALNLPSAMRGRFVELGLIPAQPLVEGYPLSRRIDTATFPYPRRPGSPEQPNLVLTLVEQLNRDFVYALSNQLRGVMPELSALTEQTTAVTEYESITQPTIQAVVASLCSIHMSTPTRILHQRHGGEALERTPLRCLPEILRAHGYHSVYIQSGDPEFAGTHGFLRAHGFDELYGSAEIKGRFPQAEAGRWGLHDDVLLAFAQEKIEALEAQRQAGGPPFFVFLQTIDTHYPGHAPAECKSPKALDRISKDANSRRMLRALYCTDIALGRFTRFLLDQQRRDATLWALSGDHPTWAGAQFVVDLYKRSGSAYQGFAAPLPLYLHDPLHELPARVPVLSGHLDLAPTLLHILGWASEPAAMTGFSIFGTRPNFPTLFGRMPPERAAVYRPGHTESRTPAQLLSECAKRSELIAHDSKAPSACELLSFMHFEDALWKYKRILPPPPPAAQSQAAMHRGGVSAVNN